MNRHTFPQLWTAMAWVAIGAGVFATRAQAQPGGLVDDQPGVEVLTRGPVHEAFAETVTFDTEPGFVVPKAPPDIIEELPPEYRPEGINVTWIPGYWAWDDERDNYLWVSGVWRDLPPGRQWVPGYWGQSRHGYQWTSGYWADASSDEIEYLPEPPESIELGPNIAAPAVNLGWIPGTWVWHHDRYAWRPGYWAAGRLGWVWVPAHYIWAPRGYIYSDGYWDYPVVRRGVLFAPVYFEEEVYLRRGYSYSPTFSINLAVFIDQLFVRPHYRHYYFGDYYDNRYRDVGFFASFSYHSSRFGYDPIYAHRRWEHRRDRDWELRDRETFAHRRDFAEARPARTLLAQREYSARTARPGESRIEVASLYNQLVKRTDSPQRFLNVDKTEREQLAQRGRAIQNTRGERQKLDNRTASVPTDSRYRPNEKPAGADEKSPRVTEPRSRTVEPARVKLPKSQIVSKPVDQLDKDRTPPKRHIVPKPDQAIQPKARQADNTKEARRVPPSNRGDSQSQTRAQPPTKRPEAKPQSPRNEPNEKRAEPKRDTPRQEPKEQNRGDSKDKPKDEKKSKDESKKKP